MQNTIESNQIKARKKILVMVQFSILLGIQAIVCFTPLGSIPVGPIVATIMFVPTVITALLMGTLAGSLMGFFAGLFSFIVWTFQPPSVFLAFLFTPFHVVPGTEVTGNFASLLICFVPRILVGTFSGLIFAAFNKLVEKSRGNRFYTRCAEL
jgi:uncharacterized membrane protein